jgi:hypothetical protein
MVKYLVLAYLDYVIVKIVSFSMSSLCLGPNYSFQHVWIMSWSILSVSAGLDFFWVQDTTKQINYKINYKETELA